MAKDTTKTRPQKNEKPAKSASPKPAGGHQDMGPARPIRLTPYLFLDGRCEEAIELYKRVLGAEVGMLMRFKDNPEPQPGMAPSGSENKIMHASIKIGSTLVMLSDGRCQGKPNFQGFALSLAAPDIAAADRMFAALGEGGQAQMPMTKTFFSPRFGMVADRFGVSWMIIVEP